MAIKLYSFPASPPCRTVLLAAKSLGVELDVIPIDLMKGEHKTPMYKKKNPQHTIPFLDDDGFTLAESRAIVEYLSDAYAKSDLLPREPKKRALVSARLHFDATTLYSAFKEAFLAPIFTRKPASDEDFVAVREALTILDTYIGNGNLYLVGNERTIADVAIASTLSNFELIDYDLGGFKNVLRFYENSKRTMPDFDEICIKGGELLGNIYKNAHKKQ